MLAKDLKADKKNPRKISASQKSMLKKALTAFGDLSGIVHNIRTDELVGGHQRLTLLPPTAEITLEREYDPPTKTGTVAEGYILVDGEKFVYRRVDVDRQTQSAMNIAANQQGGDFDDGPLTEMVDELFRAGLDMELLGFEAEELAKVMGLEEKPELENLDQKHIFEVVVTCENEAEQEETYNRLTSEGLKCRVLSM